MSVPTWLVIVGNVDGSIHAGHRTEYHVCRSQAPTRSIYTFFILVTISSYINHLIKPEKWNYFRKTENADHKTLEV